MMNRWHDCRCEDFPCCGHYDEGDFEPEFREFEIDHDSNFDEDDDPDTDDEDVIAMRRPNSNPVKAVIEAFEEFDTPMAWSQDYDRGEVFDD